MSKLNKQDVEFVRWLAEWHPGLALEVFNLNQGLVRLQSEFNEERKRDTMSETARSTLLQSKLGATEDVLNNYAGDDSRLTRLTQHYWGDWGEVAVSEG